METWSQETGEGRELTPHELQEQLEQEPAHPAAQEEQELEEKNLISHAAANQRTLMAPREAIKVRRMPPQLQANRLRQASWGRGDLPTFCCWEAYQGAILCLGLKSKDLRLILCS